MAETLRTFIAVELTEEIRTVLKDIQGRLQTFHADIKWVEPSHIHLTLKFLGDVRSQDIPLLTETLHAVLKGTPPIPTELTELGAFPDLRHPRVLWAGLKDEDGRITRLAAAIETALGKIGYGALPPHSTNPFPDKGEHPPKQKTTSAFIHHESFLRRVDKKEQRDFKAHVTLGRVRSLKNIAPLMKELQEYRFPRAFPHVIAGITLFKSTLTSCGPVYKILEKFNFSNSDPHPGP